MTKLEKFAVMVAIEAPAKQAGDSFAARVPWSTVQSIRTELERRGIDWRPMQRRVQEITEENKRKAADARAARYAASLREGATR